MTRQTRNPPGSAARLAGAILALAMVGLLCGCVTSARYRLAPRHTPAAQRLDLKAPTAPLEIDLGTVITFKGPGSWKSEARWDEYVVAVVNRGAQPLVVESAELIDVQQVARFPGEDPWKLEALSRTNWERYHKAGLAVATGGGVVLYGAAVADVAAGPWLAGGAAGSAMMALAVIPVVAIADVSVVAVMNHQNRLAVEKEFQRRRLLLPQELAPGQTAQGSLFFPMTPGPQRLMVHGRIGGEPVVATLELPTLAGLHLKPAT